MSATRSLPERTPTAVYPNGGIPSDALGLSLGHMATQSLQPPCEQYPTITYYDGGRLAEIDYPKHVKEPLFPSFDDLEEEFDYHEPQTKNQNQKEEKKPKRRITGFSRRSRSRLFRMLNKIRRKLVKRLPYFVHLTYPDDFPRDRDRWRRDLDRFFKAMRKKYGSHFLVWRREFIDRKSGQNAGQVAPHYHVLLFLDAPVRELRGQISRLWWQACGKLSDAHLRAGTKVQEMQSWRRVMGYAAKYTGKIEDLTGPERPEYLQETGAHWGFRGREVYEQLLRPVRLLCSWPDALYIRRVLRRFGGLRQAHQYDKLTCFVGSDAVEALLIHLGYAHQQQKE